VVAVLDKVEDPAHHAPYEQFLLDLLPAFGRENEVAMGRLLAGLMRSYLDAQGAVVRAELRRLLPGDAPGDSEPG